MDNSKSLASQEKVSTTFDEHQMANSYKRPFEGDLMVYSLNKKMKEETKKNGLFVEGKMPENVFPLENSVFVVVCNFRGKVSVHIRRYKKHGNTFYPTIEGVTLLPHWIEHIMGREKIPEKEKDLQGGFLIPENRIKISSNDFEHFTFVQNVNGKNKSRKEITITSSQWTQMLSKYDQIATVVLDYIFRSMEFMKEYIAFDNGAPLDKALPCSLDNTFGERCVREILKETLCEFFKEKGLKEPEMLAEELWGNREKDFNSIAFDLELRDIVDSFYHNLWEDRIFLLKKPAMYLTQNFFKTVTLDSVIREIRSVFCPPNTFEYFDY